MRYSRLIAFSTVALVGGCKRPSEAPTDVIQLEVDRPASVARTVEDIQYPDLPSDAPVVAHISIGELKEDPTPYIGKLIVVDAYYPSSVDGPWLCGDSERRLRDALSVTGMGKCSFIDDGAPDSPNARFRDCWVEATGVLRKGPFLNVPWNQIIEDHLHMDLRQLKKITKANNLAH